MPRKPPLPADDPGKPRGADAVIVLDILDVKQRWPDVDVDGQPIPMACWSRDGMRAEIPVRPGRRKVTVKKNGYKTDERTPQLPEGSHQVIRVRLDKLPSAPNANPPANDSPQPTEDKYKQARAFILDVWPTLDTAGLKNRLPEAEQALAECRRAKDFAAALQLLRGAEAHQTWLKAELDELRPPLSSDDEKSARQIKEITPGLNKLIDDVTAFLQAEDKSFRPRAKLARESELRGSSKAPAGDSPKAPLTPREKHMLRWTMVFNTNTNNNTNPAVEYVLQLRGLGAILAIPVKEAPEPEYKIVRNIRRPAKLLPQDMKKIYRIY
jgi:hypothetical protein